MAYYTSEDTDKASFNDAGGQSIRLHELAKRLIDSRVSPFQRNFIYGGIYNYELRISTLRSLWSEIKTKCTEAEILFIDKLREIVDKTMEDCPPASPKSSTEIIINWKHWDICDKHLTRLEDQIRKLQDVHGLGNPTKDREEGI